MVYIQNEPSNKLAILFFISDEKGRILSADNFSHCIQTNNYYETLKLHTPVKERTVSVCEFLYMNSIAK
jgi:hypothetical protein